MLTISLARLNHLHSYVSNNLTISYRYIKYKEQEPLTNVMLLQDSHFLHGLGYQNIINR